MRTMCSREIFTKKCLQQQIFDSDLKGAWHYNHLTFTPIGKNVILYCRLIYMLSILCVRLTIKLKVGIPESFKVGWHPLKKTGSSHLKGLLCCMTLPSVLVPQKKEMEPPNQNASQIARIHINITILKGMPANRRERRAPQIGFCTLCFCFPTKMLHLNAPFFPLKYSVSPKKSLKCSDNAHYTNVF